MPGLRRLLGDRFHYFKGIRSYLRANGFDVRHTNLDFAGSVQKRAGQLAAQVGRVLGSSSHKVHIVAHSMGGLDARHMIVNSAGMAGKIATLTTIGTPHQGTVFADQGLSAGGEGLISAVRGLIDLQGFKALTTAACQKFNEQALEAEAENSVVYQTYSSSQERNRVLALLQPSWGIIEKTEGANDGLVSVKSQAWVPELVGSKSRKSIIQRQFPFAADHLNEVGWWDRRERPEDAKSFEGKVKAIYLALAEDLLERERQI